MEPRFEDYGPDWRTVRELDAGKLEYHGPSIDKERHVLGMPFRCSVPGDSCVFDFVWLDREEAAAKWDELGLGDEDFKDGANGKLTLSVHERMSTKG